jgi:hypothetical protein
MARNETAIEETTLAVSHPAPDVIKILKRGYAIGKRAAKRASKRNQMKVRKQRYGLMTGWNRSRYEAQTAL